MFKVRCGAGRESKINLLIDLYLESALWLKLENRLKGSRVDVGGPQAVQ